MKVAPYGTWSSPITADAILAGTITVAAVIVDAVTFTVYHIEKLPSGSYTIINTTSNYDLLKSSEGNLDVRTGVHEYGGGAAIVYNGTAYFSNYIDGRVYAVREGEKAKPVSPESKVYRYANFAVHPVNQHILVGILEDHTHDTPQTIVNTICAIDTRSSTLITVLAGADFYSSPVFSPDGKKLAWISWNHPDMQWEGSELYVADVDTTGKATITLANITHVAGHAMTVGVAYPLWTSNTNLLFTSDKSGFSNPWVYLTVTRLASPVLAEAIQEDFGDPAWQFGTYPYAPSRSSNTSNNLVSLAYRDGRSVLYILNVDKGSATVVASPFVSIRDVCYAGYGKVVFLGNKSTGAGEITLLSIPKENQQPNLTTLKSTEIPGSIKFPDELMSKPLPITLRIGPSNSPLYVVYYAPKNLSYTGSSIEGEKPPCVVNAHGGPTSMTKQDMSWTTQYYTSRGWAWLDVNYGGSSGFGREYISRLTGQWGIVDTCDCLTAAKALTAAPYSLIDAKRTVIRGGSAGGYTTLAALSLPNIDNTFWAAATSMYGISNLRALAGFTHKLELRYMDKLLGGTVDEIPKVYDEERSPIFYADSIKVPLLIQQGSLDRVVLPEQGRAIASAIERRGGKVRYTEYEGEGHGWRKDKNRKIAMEEEYEWYSDVMGLKIEL